MHGLINRALQGFLQDTYGAKTWDRIREIAGLPFDDFETMLRYDHALTMDTFRAACLHLELNPNAMLEDLGTYCVTDPKLEPLRRLLRFGGSNFHEFLQSLDELAERGQLAIPDLEMPHLTLESGTSQRYRLRATWVLPGVAPLLLGGLRAMADDYGALVVLSLGGVAADGAEYLDIELLDAAFSDGRRFDLGQVAQ